MANQTATLTQAVAGVMAAERRIISLAESKGLRGLRFEWNDDIDFGHLQDPVPVSIHTPAGRTVEVDFSMMELGRLCGDGAAADDVKLQHIVDALAGDG